VTVEGKVAVVNPGAEAVTVMVCEPGEIGLPQAISRFPPATAKSELLTENETPGTAVPLEVTAVSVSTTLPITAFAATLLDPLTPIVIVGLAEATTAIVKVRSAVVYPGAEAVRSTVCGPSAIWPVHVVVRR
jgi:hypothetical protein